jgi:hypothetical protein
LAPQTSSPVLGLPEPLLSVVLTVVDGGEALRRCLRALLTQTGAPAMEILVPYDSTAAAVAAILDEARREGAPTVRGMDLGHIHTERSPLSAGGQHELIDRRRSAGLAAARGELVGILEDRGVPRPDWAATAWRLHRELRHQVIGGAIENGREGVLSWAVYLCDFGRYQRPFSAGPRPYVSDVNVVYKRRALEQTREIWRERYHEPLVHGALESGGEALFLSPDLVVDQMRDRLGVTGLVRERIAWGRLFGALRARDATLAKRIGLIVLSPIVPGVLFLRLARDQSRRRGSPPRLARVAPAAFLLMCAWAFGEAVGSLRGTP